MDSEDLLSGLQVEALLAERRGLSRRQVTAILASGVVRPVGRLRRTKLFSAADVAQLLARESVDADDDGLRSVLGSRRVFVVRLGSRASRNDEEGWLGWDQAEGNADEQRDAVAKYWTGGRKTLEEINRNAPHQPLLATVGSFVVGGWDISHAHLNDDSKLEFELKPPGSWYAEFAGRWFPSGRGGPWVWWPR